MLNPTERESFEAFMRVDTTGFSLEREGESYKDFSVATYWHFWQARAMSTPATQPAPEGYKLVPLEPTAEMLDAAARASLTHLLECIRDPSKARKYDSEEMCKLTYASRYRSMLDAAPEVADMQATAELRRLHAENSALLSAQDAQEKALLQELKKRDEVMHFANQILDLVLGDDRNEWSSAYGLPDALLEVEEKMVALERAAAPQATQGEQEPVAWLHKNRLGGVQAFTTEPPPGLKAQCQPLYTSPIATQGEQARDAAFEAVRKKLCKLPKYSFIHSAGAVRSMRDATGNWIEFDAVHALFDPVAVDAAIDAALSATPALPATEDSSAGDLVEALPGSTAGQWCTAYFNKHGFYPSIVQAFEAGASQAEVQAEPVADDYPHEQMDALALARYKVVPSDQSMYWRHAVVAGDGQQHIYNGSEVDCQNMARKFAGAFLDGAFAFHERRTAPQAQPSDALDAETTKKAARYDWLRSGNDYQSDGPMVVLYESEGDRGDRPYWSIASDALDASIDAAMAAAQDKRRILYTSPVATPQAQQHPDDAAVDALATAMKAKLAKQRAKGYGDWDTDCPRQRLSDMLRDHVDKGDPVDVANFCAFLAARGEGIAAQHQTKTAAQNLQTAIASAFFAAGWNGCMHRKNANEVWRDMVQRHSLPPGDDYWFPFLKARSKAIRDLHAEGKTFPQIVAQLNLQGAEHAERIHLATSQWRDLE